MAPRKNTCDLLTCNVPGEEQINVESPADPLLFLLLLSISWETCLGNLRGGTRNRRVEKHGMFLFWKIVVMLVGKMMYVTVLKT